MKFIGKRLLQSSGLQCVIFGFNKSCWYAFAANQTPAPFPSPITLETHFRFWRIWRTSSWAIGTILGRFLGFPWILHWLFRSSSHWLAFTLLWFLSGQAVSGDPGGPFYWLELAGTGCGTGTHWCYFGFPFGRIRDSGLSPKRFALIQHCSSPSWIYCRTASLKEKSSLCIFSIVLAAATVSSLRNYTHL